MIHLGNAAAQLRCACNRVHFVGECAWAKAESGSCRVAHFCRCDVPSGVCACGRSLASATEEPIGTRRPKPGGPGGEADRGAERLGKITSNVSVPTHAKGGDHGKC